MVKNIFKSLITFVGINTTSIAGIWALLIDEKYISILIFTSVLIQISVYIRNKRIIISLSQQAEIHRVENISLKQDQKRMGW